MMKDLLAELKQIKQELSKLSGHLVNEALISNTTFHNFDEARCRSESWRLLCRLNDIFDLPWVCGGDFNEILSINTKKGGADCRMSAMNEFQQALDKHGGAPVQERLDRYFCNQGRHDLFPSVKVINVDLFHSDHRPIVATLENIIRLRSNDKKRSFRFKTHWLKDATCHEIVNKTWLSPDFPLASQDSLLDIF
ncbi:hypothetical protein G4B88_003599 [Cannabis sativa]|uniref:Endonuclease/exonuclease/phosphatase domain-containing protein n=1 Tax=Cannabis sativa TaxID=3483 RepID=A0A7J6FB26_CANSA|nr:hypothetical protein G4B88_003599 [Cannabis sativa]